MAKYNDAFEQCLKYFNGDELAASVCVSKYLLRDGDEMIETSPEQMHRRLAKEYARIEERYVGSLEEDEIFELLDRFKYIIPAGSPMFGIGNEKHLTSISNCFVVGQPRDSYGGILQKDQELAQIMKRRGGVGIDLSSIRPSGMAVNNAARSSTGIIAFLKRYSNTTLEVAQGGRRGALMVSLDCNHPDVLEFIRVKRDLKSVSGANISIKWRDEFLKAVENDGEYHLRWPVDAKLKDASYTSVVNAKEIWEEFIESNWLCGDPGCMFWDRMIGQSISDCYAEDGFQTITTNPCGEIPLSDKNSCMLMSINLASFIENPYTSAAAMNWSKFEEVIGKASRLIDDQIDIEIEKCQGIISKIHNDPEPSEVKQAELILWEDLLHGYIQGRRVGLGILGLADMLARYNLKYGSEEALEFVSNVFRFFQETCYTASAVLAGERGPFMVWDWKKEKSCHYIGLLSKATRDLVRRNGRRNIAMNTCAPTGSLSILTQTSSGIEPVFVLRYKRNRKMNEDDFKNGIEPTHVDEDGVSWTSFDVVHHGHLEWMKLNSGVAEEESPYFQQDATSLSPEIRVRMQSTIQNYIDHSISSTVNLPTDCSRETMSKIYFDAWKGGCKGITIFRDGCKKGVIETEKKDDPTPAKDNDGIEESFAPKRPEILECDIHYSSVNKDSWLFFVGKMDGVPYEIFGGKRCNIEIPKKYRTGWIIKDGKKNGKRTYDLVLGSLTDENERIMVKDIAAEFSPDAGSYTRMISLSLRHGVPIHIICKQMKKDDKSCNMFSFERAVSRILSKYISDGSSSGEKCECGSTYVYKDGCMHCMQCGNSKCG